MGHSPFLRCVSPLRMSNSRLQMSVRHLMAASAQFAIREGTHCSSGVGTEMPGALHPVAWLPQFASAQNKTAQVRSAIKAHRDTWVTEADFSFVASIGMNCVRLPVGYWVLAQTQVIC